MADTIDHQLMDTVRQLGTILGETIQAQLGNEWLQRIETIRKQGRRASQGDERAASELKSLFSTLDTPSLLTIGRAFAQFLNLANIAEQEYNSSHQGEDPLALLMQKLEEQGLNSASISDALEQLDIDLVLTAHPTEVTRRTLIHKYSELAQCLATLNHQAPDEAQRQKLIDRISALISQAWHTEEIRSVRPTPVDEAQWGFSVIENSLWDAVPDCLRDMDNLFQKQFGQGLPLDACPIRFSSWMGGDRDGNPFVTAKITEEVLLLARKRAARLFFSDVNKLQVELSMGHGNQALMMASQYHREPYRHLLRKLRDRLEATHDGISDYLAGKDVDQSHWISRQSELLEPLMLCYRSLMETGLEKVANAELLDTIRRAHCFGIHLLKLDVRQHSERHSQVVSELTRYLGLGDYLSWSEEDKQAFLLRELTSKRPLLPRKWQPSEAVQEVLDTCKVLANNDKDGFGIYIISMASQPSDVLCVQLLLKEAGIDWPMPVAPLFETLDDLNNAHSVMGKLLEIDWYRGYIQGRQFVMIGYSDSAKDAGAIAAGWAQYESQEKLVALTDAKGIELTLFHGRGGTIGRGGLPAHAAILSQPPGSLKGGFRVTEQGETIRYKFGMPPLAKRSLKLYASAILQAMLLPPPQPKQHWREVMQVMAAAGRDNYRKVIRQDPEFVPYFRAATPEEELGKLPLGSRPSKRKPEGGVESLRAIPWIFAWAQNRMVLPAWLGVMKAVQNALDQGHEKVLEEMLSDWPFFKTRLSMLDMVFGKADPRIAAEYDARLVPDNLKHFGEGLRKELAESQALLLKIMKQSSVMEQDPKGKESIQIRAGYLEPLHLLQIELLARTREHEKEGDKDTIERAMMIAIAGIAVGMRNTG
ncbi:phosphoenolpyruvate carboxylase [Aliiglaciecola sp. CAU 1673]|uniref:phosphoenolpyruvate carboxylase n=1 Tax=Aliiglaciecola sp. CAU 1673 TaxID=3032595 RepID=UPI0023DBB730|nr:phosphoenolpyruvate carboxylase [Aliiglaciecola sp. CAU 1673]MDF2177223.1 phosphoenolpyruvate carboxylase [Aliiglaciecola sp. CAU 1673]